MFDGGLWYLLCFGVVMVIFIAAGFTFASAMRERVRLKRERAEHQRFIDEQIRKQR